MELEFNKIDFILTKLDERTNVGCMFYALLYNAQGTLGVTDRTCKFILERVKQDLLTYVLEPTRERADAIVREIKSIYNQRVINGDEDLLDAQEALCCFEDNDFDHLRWLHL